MAVFTRSSTRSVCVWGGEGVSEGGRERGREGWSEGGREEVREGVRQGG